MWWIFVVWKLKLAFDSDVIQWRVSHGQDLCCAGEKFYLMGQHSPHTLRKCITVKNVFTRVNSNLSSQHTEHSMLIITLSGCYVYCDRGKCDSRQSSGVCKPHIVVHRADTTWSVLTRRLRVHADITRGPAVVWRLELLHSVDVGESWSLGTVEREEWRCQAGGVNSV